jgi:hypothetical protein
LRTALVLLGIYIANASPIHAQDACPKPVGTSWGVAVLPFSAEPAGSELQDLVDSARVRIVASLCTAGIRVVRRDSIQSYMNSGKPLIPARFGVFGSAAAQRNSLLFIAELSNTETSANIRRVMLRGHVSDLSVLADSAGRLFVADLRSNGRQ